MSFTNAFFGGQSRNRRIPKTHIAEIELLEQLKINDFIKGIIDHRKIQVAAPNMQDVF